MNPRKPLSIRNTDKLRRRLMKINILTARFVEECSPQFREDDMVNTKEPWLLYCRMRDLGRLSRLTLRYLESGMACGTIKESQEKKT